MYCRHLNVLQERSNRLLTSECMLKKNRNYYQQLGIGFMELAIQNIT